MEEFTVVKYVGESKPSWGLENGKLYAVETGEDYVINFTNGVVTLWNDKGGLAEAGKEDYELVVVNEREWFKVRPNTYLERY